MTDLFEGRTMTEAFKFISGGAALTFTFGFQPDKVVFNNLTQWTNTAGNLPVSVWFRTQTDDAESYQQQVIDSAAAQSFNFLNSQTNGFTVADTSGGVTALRALISGITLADPAVITTAAAHGFQSEQIVRITDLGSDVPTPRGGDEFNNNRYRITVINTTSFSLKDVITDEAIDSTNFTAWVSGGRVDIETRVITINNPQAGTYTDTKFAYDPIEYKLTAGTDVIGADSDIFLVEVIRWGSRIVDLGDLG